MLVQHKQVVNVQLAAITLTKKRVEPPEEGPVIDAAGGLRRVSAVLGTQRTTLVQGLKHKNDGLDYDRGYADVGDGLIQMICSTQPQSPSVSNVKQECG
jgi:hypothetical protein